MLKKYIPPQQQQQQQQHQQQQQQQLGPLLDLTAIAAGKNTRSRISNFSGDAASLPHTHERQCRYYYIFKNAFGGKNKGISKRERVFLA